jgi:hypothetical protein
MLRMMLDAHSSLAIPPETYFFSAPWAAPSPEISASAIVERMVKSPIWGDFSLTADEFAQTVRDRQSQSATDVLRDKTKPLARRNPSFAQNDPETMRALVSATGYEILEEDVVSLWHSAVIRFGVAEAGLTQNSLS